MRSKRTITLLVLFVAAIIIAAVFGANWVFDLAFRDDYLRLERIHVGMTEADVVAHLGTPYLIYDRATAPDNYYVEGYAYKRRPITNRVLIYLIGVPIAYVYIDDTGHVEEVFIGGS